MKKYRILYLPEAWNDIEDLFLFIISEYKTYRVADKYVSGIKKEIEKLYVSPESYPVQYRPYFLQFGTNVRRINYKKMAIIYTVHGDVVYIHRIVPASMVTGL